MGLRVTWRGEAGPAFRAWRRPAERARLGQRAFAAAPVEPFDFCENSLEAGGIWSFKESRGTGDRDSWVLRKEMPGGGGGSGLPGVRGAGLGPGRPGLREREAWAWARDDGPCRGRRLGPSS